MNLKEDIGPRNSFNRYINENNNYINRNNSQVNTNITRQNVQREAAAESNSNKLTQFDATPGKKVRHGKFGIGTIVSAVKSGEDVKLTIAFDRMGVKILMLSVAPLEAV